MDAAGSRTARLLSSALPCRRGGATTWVRDGCIGRGAFGTVSLAHDKSSGRVFAVKSVKMGASVPPSSSSSSSSAAAADCLENEIRVLRSLRSPHIVSYVGEETTVESATGVHRNLLMEYVPGGTVADVAGSCREKGVPMDERAVRCYTRCVARALLYLHSEGVVHGDVKGRNVLAGVSADEAKLADFGSARRISGGGRKAANSGAGGEAPRGTPLWMAPEVVRGEPTSLASDVWSLGCTVVEMATGRPPWSDCRHQDAGHLLLRIALGGQVPEFPAELSRDGRDFLDRCLRRNPTERWSCEQLLRHPFLAEETGSPSAYSPRSALEWANFGFESEEDEEELLSPVTTIPGLASSISDDALRGRVRDLASEREASWEDTQGWEEVRPACPATSLRSGPDETGDSAATIVAEQGTAGTSPEFPDCEVPGREDGKLDEAMCPSPSGGLGDSSFYSNRRRRRTVRSGKRRGDCGGSAAAAGRCRRGKVRFGFPAKLAGILSAILSLPGINVNRVQVQESFCNITSSLYPRTSSID